MKDRKLLIPVRCTTRNLYLHRPPPGRNDWHVRFTPPSVDGTRRVVFRSTGTKEIAAAKRIAAQIIESFWIDAGRGAEVLKLRNNNATIGELITKYQDNAAPPSFRQPALRSDISQARTTLSLLNSSSATRNAATGEAGLSNENFDMLIPSLPLLSQPLGLPVCFARFPAARLWLKDESLEDSANLPDPDMIAAEVMEDLQAALAQFAALTGASNGRAFQSRLTLAALTVGVPGCCSRCS